MAILVGIDEAGFGPILGPLIVSSSTFSVPRGLLDSDLWLILQKSISSRRKHLAGRLLITDSKKAFNKKLGIKHLQRTTLACLRSLNKEIAGLTELLETLCPDSLERLSNYPWYKKVDEYKIQFDSDDLSIASQVFHSDLNSNDIELLDLESCCLDVGYYNKMVSNVKNKANVLFSVTSRLIKRAYDNFGSDDLQIIVDRQGGRIHYRGTLQRMFEDMELKVVRETEAASSYELEADGRKMRLHFVVGADKRFLPVSLASMVSKYLRQLLVDNINRYFAGYCAELKPTAGYWQDGLRFIKDVKENIPHLQYDSNQLIRCR